MSGQQVGLGGFAAYFPRARVDLQQWCAWTGADWSKIRAVIGSGFRLPGPRENVYTLAATAAMRLIRQYDLDPGRIGMLALGTESSTDNSAGAVIVKGMIDGALEAESRPTLARDCEVPEFKHACLGGMYGLKNAARYLLADGADRQAIVIAADIAEYERGSTGEATQGAGAVAMLVEPRPRLLEVDLAGAGSASAYRGADFRKPFLRYARQDVVPGRPLKDFPVFNGRYSTACYVDEVLRSMEALAARSDAPLRRRLETTRAMFMHRPYRRMPETSLGMVWLYALATGDADDRRELEHYCALADVDPDSLVDELRAHPALFSLATAGRADEDPFPLASRTLKAFRATEGFSRSILDRLDHGSEVMAEVGNLYTAALPAWIAAGLEQAAAGEEDWTGAEILTIGYGSGDAAEAIPMRVTGDWRPPARRIGIQAALEGAEDLTREQYEALHDRGECPGWPSSSEFLIESVGTGACGGFQEYGIERYRHVRAS